MDMSMFGNIDPKVIEIIQKKKESIILCEQISLDELYSEMEQNKARLPGEFRLKKGLFGTSIVFDKYMGYCVAVKVKGAKVTMKRIDPGSNSKSRRNQSAEHLAEMGRSAQSVISSIMSGEVSDDLLGGPNYFKNICEVMRELMKDRWGTFS